MDRLRLGLVSCANYEGGYFNAYARLAERNDLDAILCAGDYLYEYGAGGYGPGAEIGRVVEPALEMTELDDYRKRFSHYRLDPDLRRLHQLYPWINTWDDHETTNDSWSGGAENHDGDGSFDGSDDNVEAETGLDWETRKKRAWKAYREWLPLDIDATSLDEPIVLYRALAYGDLADIIVMDTRIDGRDEPLFEVLSPEAPADGLYDEDRRMISSSQQTFVEQALSDSDASWRIVLQQVMLMQWRIPGIPGLPALSALLDGIPDAPGVLNDGGNSVNGDAWDGYPAERSRLFAHLRSNDITDVVVLTGDIHTTWAAELTEKPFLTDISDPLYYTPVPTGLPGEVRPLGVEFVCPSITSDNIDEILVDQGLDQQAASVASEALEAATLAGNLHIKSVDLQNHGYSIVDVSAAETVFDTFFVPRLAPSDDEAFHESWSVRKSGPAETGHRLTARSAPAASRSGVPDAPDALPVVAEVPDTTRSTSVPVRDAGMLPATGGGGSLLVGGAAAALGVVIARRAALRD
ncbi:alkaline phosphatase D family protein [Actinospongicola halichondriae]|uniref:alkaline phosphatase D family protein n=1 Tax=Actinospongicola halichondriae TaxID=3236844 RepID=UPI003D50E78D